MLNPSTADATQDDPTIRRCVGFAEARSFTHLAVVNLFALRSTDPEMLAVDHDPVGPENDKWIQEEIAKARLVVVAWGAHQFARERAAHVLKMIPADLGPVCLGKTKAGYPRHPLYVPKAQEWVEYKMWSDKVQVR